MNPWEPVSIVPASAALAALIAGRATESSSRSAAGHLLECSTAIHGREGMTRKVKSLVAQDEGKL